MQAVRTLSLVVLWVCTGFARAEHDGPSGLSSRPRLDTSQTDHVKKIFETKCLDCHDGDGKFGDDGLPTPEWRQKVIDSIHKKPGIRPMPPASKPQLDSDELAAVNRWAGIDTGEEGTVDVCAQKGTPRNPAVINQIFGDRCVACHGKLSFNPTSVLRKSHTQFLNNDGTLDFSNIGDMSEIQPYNLPDGKTSVGRILDSLTNYTMPPRANLPVVQRPSHSLFPELGTPHMTDAERRFLINYLNDVAKRENCPVNNFVSVIFTRSRTPASQKYKDSAKSCSNSGGKRIPNRKQMEAIQQRVSSQFGGSGCVWTSTFADNGQRKVLRLSGGSASFDTASEKDKCQAICVD